MTSFACGARDAPHISGTPSWCHFHYLGGFVLFNLCVCFCLVDRSFWPRDFVLISPYWVLFFRPVDSSCSHSLPLTILFQISRLLCCISLLLLLQRAHCQCFQPEWYWYSICSKLIPAFSNMIGWLLGIHKPLVIVSFPSAKPQPLYPV